MAVDGQDSMSLEGGRAVYGQNSASPPISSPTPASNTLLGPSLTVKSALSKQSSTRSRMRTFSAGTIPIALSLSNLPPSRTTTTTPDPGPSVVATGSSRLRKNNQDDNNNLTGESIPLPRTTYNQTTIINKTPPTSQYSPSVYNNGDDWQQLHSPPPKLPTLPILAATTYSPRERTNPATSKAGKSKGAAPIPASTTATSRRKSLKQFLDRQPKPAVSTDPREDKDKDKILPARPNPTRLGEKNPIEQVLQVPVSPASPSAAVTPSTRMMKVKTKTVPRKYPQLVETSSSISSGKMTNLARTKSRITRIMSFGGGGGGGDDTSGGGGGGGWWDMLDSIIPAPLKAPPRNPVVPPAGLPATGKGGFDPGNVF